MFFSGVYVVDGETRWVFLDPGSVFILGNQRRLLGKGLPYSKSFGQNGNWLDQAFAALRSNSIQQSLQISSRFSEPAAKSWGTISNATRVGSLLPHRLG